MAPCCRLPGWKCCRCSPGRPKRSVNNGWLSDFGGWAPCSQHPSSFSAAKWELTEKSPESRVSAKNPAAMFPPEFGVKHLILLIPGLLAVSEPRVFVSPGVLCFVTSLWWAVIALAEVKAEHVQGGVTKSTASRLRRVINSRHWAHLRSRLGYRTQSWDPRTRRTPANPVRSYSGGEEVGYTGRDGKLGLAGSGEPRRDLTSVSRYLRDIAQTKSHILLRCAQERSRKQQPCFAEG